MQINKSELKNNVIRYTVQTNNLKNGTITFVDHALELKIGDFVKNIQFIDNNNNRMGKNGKIEEILKIEIFRNGEFINCEII